MNCPTLFLILLLGGLATASTARAEIEFTGLLTSGGKSTFALADTATADTRWLLLGKSFSGWKITAYDAKLETLTLTKDSATKTLKLKGSVVQEAKIAAPLAVTGDISIKVGDSATAGLVTLTDGTTNEMTLPNGMIVQITPTVQPDGNILYKALFRGNPSTDGKPGQVLSQPSVMSAPGQSFSMQAGDISFGFTPKPAVGKP